jgi:hypothetical protein
LPDGTIARSILFLSSILNQLSKTHQRLSRPNCLRWKPESSHVVSHFFGDGERHVVRRCISLCFFCSSTCSLTIFLLLPLISVLLLYCSSASSVLLPLPLRLVVPCFVGVVGTQLLGQKQVVQVQVPPLVRECVRPAWLPLPPYIEREK